MIFPEPDFLAAAPTGAFDGATGGGDAAFSWWITALADWSSYDAVTRSSYFPLRLLGCTSAVAWTVTGPTAIRPANTTAKLSEMRFT